IAYERIGPAGIAAFALPPALMVFTTRQYLDRTRESVVELRETNEALSERNGRARTRPRRPDPQRRAFAGRPPRRPLLDRGRREQPRPAAARRRRPGR